MKLKYPLLSFALALTIAACNPPAAKTPEAATTTAGTQATTPPTPTLADIPANLKTDAYDYYGLSYDKPIEFEWSASNDSTGPHKGTQTFVLNSVKDGEANFTANRQGDLAQLGSEELALRPDGVYVLSSDKAKISGDRLEIPVGLTPGKTWKNHQKVELNGSIMDVTNEWKVVGMQKFSTKAGTYDGLLITTLGRGKIDKDNVTIDSKMWLVKGRGALKYTLTINLPKGEKRTVSVQETK